MLQVVNLTPFQAHLMVLPNEQGVECAYAMVKATFRLRPEVVAAEEQLPFVHADVYWGDPGVSSLRYASESTLIKPTTDVILIGSAHASGGRPTAQVDVTLRVGELAKTVRVFGDRTWQKGWFTTRPSSPQPFVHMPLVYERAFGGTDASREQDGIVEADSRNPVGVGFRGEKSCLEIDGATLPNVEVPDRLLGSPKDRPEPAGFGAICGHWEPRRGFAGTYDEAWQNGRAPYLPLDFDPRFFNVAHPGLVAPGYLSRGVAVSVENASPDGQLTFSLPDVQPRITYKIDGEDLERFPNLDTVTIEPDEERLTLVWRTMAPCDKKAQKVRQIVVSHA